MRATLAASSADRISRCAVLVAWALCGILVFFVAVPLAISSPFPPPREGTWVIERASAPITTPVAPIDEQDVALESELAGAWGFVSLPESGLAGRFEPAEFGDPQPDNDVTGSISEPAPAKSSQMSAPSRKSASLMDEVDAYLWEVYQRAPIKRDASGDFTWKDPAAAKRFGLPMPAYVIGGMDPDFREQLYHAGRAMDAAGIRWSMLSAFRDDYRQRIASGLKASTGNSAHGGSARTGGYGHGQAMDVTAADGNDDAVWRWLDAHGTKYGLYRPLPGADPAHVQARSGWHKLALALRGERVGGEGTRVAAAAAVKTKYADADR